MIEIRRPGAYQITVPSMTVIPGLSGDIRIPEFQVNVLTASGRSQATAAVLLSGWGKKIARIELRVAALHAPGINITNGSLIADRTKAGRLAIEEVSAGRLAVGAITADASLDGNTLILANLSGRLLAGSAQGNARISLGSGLPFQTEVRVSGVDLAAAVSEFRVAERFELSGIVDGEAFVRGSAAGFGQIRADLTSRAPGGALNILDQRVIDIIASRSGQARDLVSRSFTDYRYDRAQASVYTSGNRLILDIGFEGTGGTRTLQAVLHDFSAQGGNR
ncbi:MAG TPA: YdbH domain-containing protein [Candidatus Omnitrophota bacterium]|nr:YdbH domain-containing protein [Candidatus Omnitrophota bacterium]HQJ15269.1 YdbH domain-containing protein [Candidatus Omnitrophota bacterium]